ncbi:MAG: hypothetical protein M8364_11975 [Methylobacter sp.]|uniref:hypothetical protein n=1 Tax=Methylobacter sp. TaxID=2051955 RepID=UPI00258615F2|nr:hypothetical protein [Methylobacter sp.]MCL7421610.1 hypothetical protein [Methylobacter sp.]
MKRKHLSLLAASLLISGCVATQYEKSIAVTKDANGKIISTTLTERVVQPNQNGWPVKFEYLNGIQPD